MKRIRGQHGAQRGVFHASRLNACPFPSEADYHDGASPGISGVPGLEVICNIDDHLSVAVPGRLFILDSGIAGKANRERTMGPTLTSFGGSALTLLADKALSRKLARLAVKPCINAWNSGVSATPLTVRELFDGSMMTVTLFRSAVRPTVIQSANLPAALAL